jgi:hypothetical protein
MKTLSACIGIGKEISYSIDFRLLYNA